MKLEISSNIESLGTTLFLIFLVLKTTGVIAWSWWWVTSPLWIPLAFVLGFAIVVGIRLLWLKYSRNT